MLRIAIVEKETFAKDVIFELQRVLKDEFAFFYFEKISQLVKSPRLKEYDIIILNEAEAIVNIKRFIFLLQTAKKGDRKTDCLLVFVVRFAPPLYSTD